MCGHVLIRSHHWLKDGDGYKVYVQIYLFCYSNASSQQYGLWNTIDCAYSVVCYPVSIESQIPSAALGETQHYR